MNLNEWNSIWIIKQEQKKKKKKTQFTLSHYFYSFHYFHYYFSRYHRFLFFWSIFARLRLRLEVAVFLIFLIFFAREVVDFLFFFLLFFRFFFRRDLFFCVDLCFRHVNEIRNFIVIRLMIVFIFFIYFVDETRSVTLCSLAKSKRRCLKIFIQRQKTSSIFSTIHNFCYAKRATQISLWARFNWIIWIF